MGLTACIPGTELRPTDRQADHQSDRLRIWWAQNAGIVPVPAPGLRERVWERAILSTIPRTRLIRNGGWTSSMLGQLSAEQTSQEAADWAIAEIQRIFAEWE